MKNELPRSQTLSAFATYRFLPTGTLPLAAGVLALFTALPMHAFHPTDGDQGSQSRVHQSIAALRNISVVSSTVDPTRLD